MNIMAIGMDWFLTIPGMLISGGVFLLFVALVIFIVTTIKSKKEQQGEAPLDSALPSETQSAVTLNDMNPVSEPGDSVIDFSGTEVPVSSEISEDRFHHESGQEIPTIFDTPIASVSDTKSDTVEMDENAVPSVEGQLEQPSSSALDQVSYVDSASSQDSSHSTAYGGAEINVPSMEEVHRPIYGGADPLEKTQGISPVVEPTSVIPEITPIVPEATLMEPVSESESSKHSSAVMDSSTSDFIVEGSTVSEESIAGDSSIAKTEAIPVETDEKIEEL